LIFIRVLVAAKDEARGTMMSVNGGPARTPTICSLTISPKVIRSLAGRVLRLPDLALTAL
jgi:hypothetical protein